MRDSASDGQWHYCEGCESHGDIVELAAKTWKLSYAAAFKKLPACGLDPDITPSCRWLDEMHTRQVRAKDVLAMAAENMRSGKGATSPAMAAVRASTTSWEDWLRGAGKMVGIVDHLAIEQIRQPNIRKAWEKQVRARWFVGRSWHDVIVTPLYDLPGRIASLMACGRKAIESDWVHRSLITLSQFANRHKTQAPFEAGFSFHPNFKPWRSRGTVFAVPSVQAGIHLQQRYFRTRATPMPLVGFVANDRMRTNVAWDMLQYANVIMWTPRLTGKILWQAYRANASLVISDIGGTSNDAIVAYIKNSSTDRLIDEWTNRARPWQIALAKFAAENPLEATEEVLLGANLPPTVMEELWAKLPDGLYEQMNPHLFVDRNIVDSRSIDSYEMRDGKLWQVRGKRCSLVCDAILKVERLVYLGNTGQLQHEGQIEFEGKSYAFATVDPLFEKDTLAWMYQFLVAQCAGTMSRSAHKHNVLPVFLQLHKPIAMTAVDRIGWNSAANRLDLPHYSLRAGGELRRHRCSLSGEYPAKTWVAPLPLDRAIAEELSGKAFEQFWALASAVVANALQPAWGEARQPIYLEGETVDQRVLEALGLCRVPLQRAGHGWPAYWATETQTIRTQWLRNERENRNVVLSLSWWGSRFMQLAKPSTIICVSQLAKANEVLDNVAPYLIPNYLEDLARRNFDLPGGGYRQARILTDMGAWLKRQGGNVAGVLAGDKHILRSSSEDINYVLGQVFAQLLLERRYALRESPLDSAGKKLTGILTDNVVTLPWDVLLRAAKLRHAPTPDLASIEQAIRRFELEQPVSQTGSRMLAVPTAWLQRHVAERRGLPVSSSSAAAD